MIVTLNDVATMVDVIDCEVMGDVIVAKDLLGCIWYTKSFHSKEYGCMDDVPFYEAKPWMVQRFAHLEGKSDFENDQLRDAEIKEFATVRIDEHSTPFDYYEPKERYGMEGAFDTPWNDIGVEL